MKAFLRGIGANFEACALADDAAAAGATGVGVDVFFSAWSRFVAASFFSVGLGLVACWGSFRASTTPLDTVTAVLV